MALFKLPPAIRLQFWTLSRAARGLDGSVPAGASERFWRRCCHAELQLLGQQSRAYATAHAAGNAKVSENNVIQESAELDSHNYKTVLMEAPAWTDIWAVVRKALSTQPGLGRKRRQRMLTVIKAWERKRPAGLEAPKDIMQALGKKFGDDGLVATLTEAHHQLAQALPKYDLPQQEPSEATSSFFEPQVNPEQKLAYLCKKSRVSFEAKKSFSMQRDRWSGQNGLTVSLRVEIGDTVSQVEGGGESKHKALMDAWRKALLDLHTRGALGRALATPPKVSQLSLAKRYPSAPAKLFDPIFTGDELVKQFDKLQGKKPASVKAAYTAYGEYRLTIRLPGIFEGRSDQFGKDEEQARVNAWLDILSQLHCARKLRKLYPDAKPEIDDDAEIVDVAQDEIKREKSAIVDIWNYAARYGITPSMEIKNVRSRARKGSHRRGETKQEVLTRVTIALPEQGIKITKLAKTLFAAETAAGVSFKRAAEELRGRSDEQVTSSLERSDILSTDTAHKFVQFFRRRSPTTDFHIEFEDRSLRGDTRHIANVTIDGTVYSSPAVRTRKDAETLADLIAAVKLATQEPALLSDFADMMRSGAFPRIRPLPPLSLHMDANTLTVMGDTIVQARKAGLGDSYESLAAEDLATESNGFRGSISSAQRAAASEHHIHELRRFEEDPLLENLRKTKAGLPMSQYGAKVLELVSGNTYSIVIGATGSGKTTQVPQIILDDAIRRGEGGWCDIICTQPRRLAASSVARRVATERNQDISQTVGYQVRGEPRPPQPGGSITYCTTGLLLEQLKSGVDEIFDNVSHLVIDEVHERDIFIDFLLIVVKKAIRSRHAAGKKVPKVILMSATLDEKLFSSYLPNEEDGKLVPCPSLAVPGRTFPVQETYLKEIVEDIEGSHGSELQRLTRQDGDNGVTTDYLQAENAFAGEAPPTIDWKRRFDSFVPDSEATAAHHEESLVPIALLTAAIARVCDKTEPGGAILAFLPGLNEIQKTRDMLLMHAPCGTDFSDPEKFKILMLHSTIPPEDQRLILEPVPAGVRKVILSTNIAETSVTVPDVKHVLDLGKSRENRYDQEKRITELQTVWASSSNVRQRAGRAGRVSDGNYYALYSRQRRQAMSSSGLPELLRSDLQDIALSIKARGFSETVSDFLAGAIEPPPATAVVTAVQNLRSIEALTEDESLTPLGRVLSRIPIHPTLGRMVLLGVIFRCLDPLITIGAMGTNRSIFANPLGERKEANEARHVYSQDESDHLAFLNAFNDLRARYYQSGHSSAYSYARRMFLHYGAFKTMIETATQIERSLVESRIIADSRKRPAADKYRLGGASMNQNSNDTALIKCLLIAGLHPNIAYRKAGTTSPTHRTQSEDKVVLHPSSTHYSVSKHVATRDRLYTFGQLAKNAAGDSLFMRESTSITPMMAVLFGGRLQMSHDDTLNMDGWLRFRVAGPSPDFSTRLVLGFRKAKDRVLNEAFKSLARPDHRLTKEVQDILTKGLVKLFKRGSKHDDSVQVAPTSWEDWSLKRERSNKAKTTARLPFLDTRA